eukprot:SAG31_NODE_29161_length_399_cov_7.303333_1_plen_51_part_10
MVRRRVAGFVCVLAPGQPLSKIGTKFLRMGQQYRVDLGHHRGRIVGPKIRP